MPSSTAPFSSSRSSGSLSSSGGSVGDAIAPLFSVAIARRRPGRGRAAAVGREAPCGRGPTVMTEVGIINSANQTTLASQVAA